MPGTLVTDASAPALAANGTPITASGNGTAVEVGHPNWVRVKLHVEGTPTGTNPTLDVEIQSCDASGFGSGVVTHGKFEQITDGDADTDYWLNANIKHRYARAVYVAGGTTPSFALDITLEESHYMQTDTDSAGPA